MEGEWTARVLSDAERQKFNSWITTIMGVHAGTKDVRNQQLSRKGYRWRIFPSSTPRTMRARQNALMKPC